MASEYLFGVACGVFAGFWLGVLFMLWWAPMRRWYRLEDYEQAKQEAADKAVLNTLLNSDH